MRHELRKQVSLAAIGDIVRTAGWSPVIKMSSFCTVLTTVATVAIVTTKQLNF